MPACITEEAGGDEPDITPPGMPLCIAEEGAEREGSEPDKTPVHKLFLKCADAMHARVVGFRKRHRGITQVHRCSRRCKGAIELGQVEMLSDDLLEKLDKEDAKIPAPC